MCPEVEVARDPSPTLWSRGSGSGCGGQGGLRGTRHAHPGHGAARLCRKTRCGRMLSTHTYKLRGRGHAHTLIN